MEEFREITEEELTDEQKLKAIAFYVKHLNDLRRYNLEHKEELNERAKRNYRNIRDNEERYEAYKQRKRELYRQKKATA